MRYHVRVGDVTFDVEIGADEVSIDGKRMAALAPERLGPSLYSFVVNGASHKVLAKRAGPTSWALQFRGRGYRVDVADERTKAMLDLSPAGSSLAGPAVIRAPMPGLVVKVEVKEGEKVEAGGGLLVVEAMKMENSLTAPVGGRVGKIHVVEGQAVEKEEVLIEMLPVDQESEGGGD